MIILTKRFISLLAKQPPQSIDYVCFFTNTNIKLGDVTASDIKKYVLYHLANNVFLYYADLIECHFPRSSVEIPPIGNQEGGFVYNIEKRFVNPERFYPNLFGNFDEEKYELGIKKHILRVIKNKNLAEVFTDNPTPKVGQRVLYITVNKYYPSVYCNSLEVYFYLDLKVVEILPASCGSVEGAEKDITKAKSNFHFFISLCIGFFSFVAFTVFILWLCLIIYAITLLNTDAVTEAPFGASLLAVFLLFFPMIVIGKIFNSIIEFFQDIKTNKFLSEL